MAEKIAAGNGPSQAGLVRVRYLFVSSTWWLVAAAGLILGLPGVVRWCKRRRKPPDGAGEPASGASGQAGTSVSPDRLASLRRLARKKGRPFAEELDLFLSEFAVELDQLSAAIRHQDARLTGRYAHLLCGRCAFVGERDLDLVMRRIEAGAVAGRWDHARRLCHAAHTSLAELPVRLASTGPVARDESAR